MRTLKDIQGEIQAVEKEQRSKIMQLERDAAEVFKVYMGSKKSIIDGLVSRLNESREVTSLPLDEYYYTWVKFNVSVLIDIYSALEVTLLKDYMRDEYSIVLDMPNDVALTCIGPAIVIQENGDVYDQEEGKWVVERREYESKPELYALIEAYMEKNGTFPAVISVDRYDNVFFVNTRNKD